MTIRELTKECLRIRAKDIYDRVDQGNLFRYYLGRDPDLPGLHTNPLRKDDNPGCGFFTNYVGALIFYDHATKEGYDIFRVMKDKYGLSFREAYFRIDEDFGLGLFDGDPVEKLEVESIPSKRKLIQVVQKRFTKDELKFWKKFGISYETLQLFGVVSVKHVYVDKCLIQTSSNKQFIFAWFFKKTNHIKVYIPGMKEGEKSQWISNCSIEDIQGEHMVPFLGEQLVITKSLKDIMLLYEFGHTAVSPTNEGSLLREGYVESLKGMFNSITVFFDNDGEFNPPKGVGGKGKQAALKFASHYGLPFVFIPDDEPKDLSDYYYKYGEEKTIELINKLFSHE